MSRNSKFEIRNSITAVSQRLLLHACCAPCSTAVYEQLYNEYDVTVYWYNPNIFPIDEHDKRLNELEKLSEKLGFSLIIDKSSKSDHTKWLNYSSGVIARKSADWQMTKQSNEQDQIAASRPIGSPNDRSIEIQQCSNLTIKQCAACPEGMQRCSLCYQMRLEKVYDYAVTHDFDLFSTTLTVSPHKNTPEILRIGQALKQTPPARHPRTGNAVIQRFKVVDSRLHDNDIARRVGFLARDYKKNNGYKRSIELSKLYGLYRQNYCGCEFSVSKSKIRNLNS